MTKLLYLENTYLFEEKAKILTLQNKDGRSGVILDQTIFYPQGGGQPADKGQIISKEAIFSVDDVRLDEDGTVWHFGEFEQGEFQKGDRVALKIDKQRRILNAKLHSAGHLLDCAVTQINLRDLTPIKGFHFPQGSYVEYQGQIENPADIIPELEKTVNELAIADLQIQKKDLSPAEAKTQGIWAPEGKSARIVNFANFTPCGCGGTHVLSSREIGKITIRKIKSKKGITRISYSI